MFIKCFRCTGQIERPDDSNADYVMATDTIEVESREIPVAYIHTAKTRADIAALLDKEPDAHPDKVRLAFRLEDCDKYIVAGLAAADSEFGDDLVAVVLETMDIPIQKTAVICPNCYKPTDFVIWGIHKAATTEGDNGD